MFDYGGSGATMGWADVLGVPSGLMQTPAPISSGGPNQAFVAPFGSSVGTAISSGPAPAISIVGMVILLVAWRVAVEFGAE